MADRPDVQPFQAVDFVVIVAYFVLNLAVGIWSSWKKRTDNVQNYFLAGRDMNWFLVGTGLFASNIGSTHFIGLTGSASRTGIAIAGFELNATFVLLLLGWLFVPVYMASGVYTLPEYLRLRFGSKRIQTYLSALSLLLYLLIRLSADLYAGSIFIEQTLNWSPYYSSIALLAVSGIYTVVGGLTAVMWTDMLQTVFVLAGATTISVLSFNAVGGYNSLVEDYPLAISGTSSNRTLIENSTSLSNYSTCGQVPKDYMSLLRSPEDPQYPWTGMVFGLTISAIWGWCSDQVLVQRCLSAKNLSHAKGGCILAGYLKALPLFLFVFPGMAARILFPDELACASPQDCRKACGSDYGCGDIAYPLLVLKLMPAGARGFMLSVMLAAIMSSLTSVFNSSSTLFTLDIWPMVRRNKHISETESVIVGRVFVALLAALSVLWLPVIKASQGSQLFNYIQSIISYLAPPVCAVYILAIFTNRINEKGAFWGLMVGLMLGLTRFVLDLVYIASPCGSNTEPTYVPDIVSKVHFLHFGCVLFLVVMVVTIAISLSTAPINEKHMHRLVFWSRHSRQERVSLDEPTGEQSSCDSTNKNPLGSGSTFEVLEEKPKPNDELRSGRWLKLLCCLNPNSRVEVHRSTAAEKVIEAEKLLHEGKFAKRFVNLNGLVLLVLSVAVWVVYR